MISKKRLKIMENLTEKRELQQVSYRQKNLKTLTFFLKKNLFEYRNCFAAKKEKKHLLLFDACSEAIQPYNFRSSRKKHITVRQADLLFPV